MLKNANHHLSFQGVMVLQAGRLALTMLTHQAALAEGWGGCDNFLK